MSNFIEAKNMWLIISASYDGSTSTVPILANDKVSVGKYIRKHVSDFIDFFISMAFLNYDYGLIRKGLKSWYKDDMFVSRVEDDQQYRHDFMEAVQNVLHEIGDENIVDEFTAYNKDCEGSFITIEKIKAKNIITV